MAVATRYPVLLAFLFLQLLQSSSAQECIYQYIHQPSQELNCNPYGRELQLHCGFIGPLSPEFNLGWYSSNAEDNSEPPQQLLHGKEEYTVNNIVLDMKTGHYIRSMSSVLRTGPINAEKHSGKCLWCQAEFGNIAHPLKSNALCIQNESRYAELDECSNALLVNTSLVCADVSDDFMRQLKREVSLRNERSSAMTDMLTSSTVTTHEVSTLMSSQEPIPSPSPSISSMTISTSVYKQVPSSMSLHTNSMVTASAASAVIPVPTVVPTTGGAAVTPSDTPASSDNNLGKTQGPGAGLMEEENGTNPNIQPKPSLEGPLYAAIVICVIFVVIIVVLVGTIVCLMRKKCGCLTIWIRSHLLWKKTTASTIATQSHALSNTIVENSDMQAMLESGLHGSNSVSYKEETDNRSRRTRSPHVRVSIEREQGDASDKRERATSLPHICNGETQQRSEKWKSRLSDELPPPPLPAKSATESEHESSGDYESIEKKCDYDHLQPVVESDNDNVLNEEHQYAELESSVKKVPPKKPPRLAHSREHYYHTLESSDESGLLRSAGTSQAGSQLSGMNEYALASSVPGLSVSNQLQEIFDDPRYAMLFVNQDHLEHIHLDNNEVSRSRSTPSLIAVDIIPFSPTSPERRSLRAVHHKRLSILNSHLIQPQN